MKHQGFLKLLETFQIVNSTSYFSVTFASFQCKSILMGVSSCACLRNLIAFEMYVNHTS